MLRARLTLKLPVLVVGAVLLTAATVAVLAISIGRGILRQGALEELVERREVYASAVDFYIGGARGLIGVTADRPAMREFARHWLTPSAAPADAAAIEGFRRALAATVLQHADAFEYLMLLKPDGTVYVLEPARLERELSHRNLAFAAWYKDALAAFDTVVSDLHISPATQRPTVVVAAPVRGPDGVIIGVWAGGLQLARLSKLGSVESSESSSRASRAYGYVADRHGLILAHQSNPNYVEQQTDFSSVPSVQRALSGSAGAGQFLNPIDGEVKLGAYRTLAGSGWVVVYAIPLAVALAPVNLLTKGILLSTAALATLVGLLAFVMARRITGPIQQLTAAARTIGTGDVAQRIDVRTGDEVQTLGEEFNRMAAALGEKEAQLHRRAEELQTANRELEAFSYSVSHDLRAPLRAMDGFTRILLAEEGGTLSPEGIRYLGLVRENAGYMGHLVDGLLTFSRLGRQAVSRTPVATDEVVRLALDELQAEQEGRHVEVIKGDLPACEGDPGLLRQVWVNLLSNAFKFTRDREEARIEVGCQTADGVPVYFVKDNGIGFDMRYAHKLFGVFQRLHRQEDYAGTGVGLAIVQRIVHRHGGRVWAEGKEGQGAAFYFTLSGGGA
jgi:signal transduction histidine kinase